MGANEEHEVEFKPTGLFSDVYQVGGHLANIGEHLVIIARHLATIGHHLTHWWQWRRDGYWSGYMAYRKGDAHSSMQWEHAGTGWTRRRAHFRLVAQWRDRAQEESASEPTHD